MFRQIKHRLLFGLVCLYGASVSAQDQAATDRLALAHGQYYTPTVSGLKSFSCEAAIDWKDMLERFGHNDIKDDNPFLKYLQTVHLSVADELNGKGSVEWATTDAPPEGMDHAIAQVRDGLKTMMGGFFQTWNVFMNGGMVPLPDKSVQVTAVGAGVHLHGTSNGIVLDEDFDKDMLLTEAAVLTSEMKVVTTPSYMNTADGRIISTVKSVINQPPSTPLTEATFHIDYTRVDTFQIPSRIAVDIKNTGSVVITLNTCRVATSERAKKP